jgi:hypothetical protein
VRAEHALGNQVRGLLRPFGIRLPSRQGTKKFAAAAHRAVQHDARQISAHARRGVRVEEISFCSRDTASSETFLLSEIIVEIEPCEYPLPPSY